MYHPSTDTHAIPTHDAILDILGEHAPTRFSVCQIMEHMEALDIPVPEFGVVRDTCRKLAQAGHIHASGLRFYRTAE